jgi:hypothetical protein
MMVMVMGRFNHDVKVYKRRRFNCNANCKREGDSTMMLKCKKRRRNQGNQGERRETQEEREE